MTSGRGEEASPVAGGPARHVPLSRRMTEASISTALSGLAATRVRSSQRRAPASSRLTAIPQRFQPAAT
jgi:hypothetical protein